MVEIERVKAGECVLAATTTEVTLGSKTSKIAYAGMDWTLSDGLGIFPMMTGSTETIDATR
jgi:hypothetical protein